MEHERIVKAPSTFGYTEVVITHKKCDVCGIGDRACLIIRPLPEHDEPTAICNVCIGQSFNGYWEDLGVHP